jgi:hypothetical protein
VVINGGTNESITNEDISAPTFEISKHVLLCPTIVLTATNGNLTPLTKITTLIFTTSSIGISTPNSFLPTIQSLLGALIFDM